MPAFDDVLTSARALPRSLQMRLIEVLASAPTPEATPVSRDGVPLPQFADLEGTRPDLRDPDAWARRERGHAVLATETPLTEADVPEGPAALFGLWTEDPATAGAWHADPQAATGANRPPAVVAADVVLELARGDRPAAEFLAAPPITPRLTTATYLELLAGARSANEVLRVRRFASPYAILSLGPVASNRAVQLLIEHGLESGLRPLDALTAATAIAHEIPLYTRSPAFSAVQGLLVRTPY